MTTDDETVYREFVQTVIDNIKKNGFPGKKVSFGLDSMYEAAYNKGINFNKVLETLDSIQIGNTKTNEKIIFYPKDKMSEPVEPSANPPIDPSMFEGIDPSMFKNFDPSMLGGMDPSSFKDMNIKEMMSAAGKMLKNMTPEQMNSMQDMYKNMSDDQKKNLIDKAKDLGFNPFSKK